MTTFMARSSRYFALIKAVRQFRREIEKAGLDNLKTLADNGVSIVGTYLNGCSPEDKAMYRRDLGTLVQMGVTPDMLLAEVARQMPEIAPIMQGKEDYRRSEIKSLERFLTTG